MRSWNGCARVLGDLHWAYLCTACWYEPAGGFAEFSVRSPLLCLGTGCHHRLISPSRRNLTTHPCWPFLLVLQLLCAL